MSETREPYGVGEYLLGEETVRPQELIWGRVRDAASPTPLHQGAVFRFAVAWDLHVRERFLGHVIISAMDCVLDEEKALIVQPDALFVSKARAHIIKDRVWGAPDLVLEVLSPKPRLGTLSERLDWFATYGVRECWLYYQDRRELEVLQFESGTLSGRTRFGYRDPISSRIFPDFDRSCESVLTTY